MQETRKQEILKVAAQLFREKGYSAVTMRDLAAKMGIKAASLYNHITSKQQILNDLIIAVAEEFTEAMETIKNSKDSSLEQLKAIIKLHVIIAIQNPDDMSALNSDWMHLDKPNYYFEMRDAYEANFKSIVNTGIANNEIDAIHVETLTFSMLTTLRTLYLWIPKQKKHHTEQLVDNLFAILINGISKG